MFYKIISSRCVRLVLLAVMLVGVSTNVIAQNLNVTGKVTDQKGEPLVGVFVVQQGTQNGASTDVDGKYKISVPANSTLSFTFMGYEDVVKPVNNKSVINVVMQESAILLNDVVIVGYGAQKKENLTGAVASVNVSKAIDSRPVTDVGRGLQGVTPGLTITIPTGEVGSDPTMKIRGAIGSYKGSSSPLILLDNVEIPSISIINPEDIESISILKDAASSSIYGAKAAFGVILIKSKKGAKTDRVTVNYSNNFAWQNAAYDINMAGTDGLRYTVDAYKRVGGSVAGAFWYVNERSLEKAIEWEKTYGKTVKPNDPVVYGRDWYVEPGTTMKMGVRTYKSQDYMIKKWAPSMKHNLSIAGRAGSTSYNIGLGYISESGMMKPAEHDDFKRYNASLNVTTDINKYVTVRAGFIYSERNKRYPYITSSTTADPWLYIYRWGPLYPMAKDEYGNVLRSPAEEARQANTANIFNGYTNVNLGTTINVTNNWKFDGNFTYSTNNAVTNRQGTRYTAGNTWIAPVDAVDENGGALTSTDVWGIYGAAGGSIPAKQLYYQTYTSNGANPDHIYRISSLEQRKAADITSTYDLQLGQNHNFKFLVGWDIATYDEKTNWSQKTHLLDLANPQFGLSDGTQTSGGNQYWDAQVGYFARVNYVFADKYLIEGNIRYGGSSKFSKDMQWRWFPSASIGWNFNKEPFMKWADHVLSAGKIRASYGVIGDQSVDSGLYIPTMSSQAGYTLDANGNKYVYYDTPGVVSADITWQDIKTLDIGVDLKFFKNELGITFDWFKRTTSNMIVGGAAMPSAFGTSAPNGNFGELATQGWELSADYNHVFKNGLGLSVTASLSDYTTKINKYAAGALRNVENTWWNGNTYGDIYGYVTDRLYTWDDFELTGDGSKKWSNLQKVKLGAATVSASEQAQGIIADPNASRDYGKSQNKVVYMQKDHNNAVYQGGLQSGSLYFGPGDVKYKDLDGDGDIWYGNGVLPSSDDAEGVNNSIGDFKKLGNSTPRYEYGLRVGLDWKGVDFSVFMQGIGSRKIKPAGFLAVAGYNSSDGAMPQAIAGDYWTWDEETQTGRTDAYYPRAVNAGADPSKAAFNNTIQSKYLLNMAYFRIKNITVGYTLPESVTRKIYINKARVFFSLENYFTFDHLNGLPVDPEEVAGVSLLNTSNYNSGRVGVGTPTFKSMSFGVQLSF